MDTFNKDVKKIILNYNDWNINKLKKIRALNYKLGNWNNFNIEKITIKFLKGGYSGFFIVFEQDSILIENYYEIKEIINNNYNLKNLLRCYIEDKSIVIDLKEVEGKIISLASLSLI